MSEHDEVPTGGHARRKPTRAEPERMPDDVRRWAGHWVAIDDGHVIEAAYSPRELAAKLHAMGPRGARAVARFIPKPSDVITIGVG